MDQTASTPMQTSVRVRQNVPPLFQIIMIAISFCTIAAVLYNQLYFVAYHEQQPPLEAMTPVKIKEFGGFPDTVKVGLYIDQFQKFDLIKNDFIFNGIIWFKVLPGIISLSTLEKFEFQQSEILYRSAPDVQLRGEELLISYNIRVKFTAPLNYIDFPVDDHKINLVFANQFVTPAEINFDSERSSFVITSEVNSFGWSLNDKEVQTGFMSAHLDSTDSSKQHNFPAVLFSMEFSRFGTRQLISILLPLLLVFYIAIFCFSIEQQTSIGLSTGAITAIIAYRFVIENLSPASGYFMLSDYLFFLILSACFITFFFNVLDVFLFTIPMKIKKAGIIAVHSFVIGVSCYLLMYLSK